MGISAREAALKVLERCRRQQAFSDVLLGGTTGAAGLDARDSALCAKLCYGVLQNMRLIDFYIDFYTENPKKLEPKVRDILRLSVYQLLFLDKIPSHAAVSQGVELCKKSGFARAGGLVNAVLRKISAGSQALPEIPNTNANEYLSIKYSMPPELVRLFISEFGVQEAEAFLAASNADTPTVIQTNTLKNTAGALAEKLVARGVTLKAHALLPDCFEIGDFGDLTCLPEHSEGLFYVQDAAARLSVLAADPQPGDTVLDACAAPGGKSFTAGLLMGGKGRIYACDIHENKLPRIREGARRLGVDSIILRTMDAASPNESFYGACDLVLADVPCSGLGVIRKKPDIRYKSLADIEKLPEVQLNILHGLAPCVKAGGTLLYSTCTVLERENDGVITRFLSEHPEFEREGFTLPEPIGTVPDGKLKLYPHRHNTDGFFICRLKKHI